MSQEKFQILSDSQATSLREVAQQVLEAEMEEAVESRKGERTAEWVGNSAGYY